MDKFPGYAERENERKFPDITSDYDKSPPPTAATSPNTTAYHSTLNGVIYENSISDLNGNTKTIGNIMSVAGMTTTTTTPTAIGVGIPSLAMPNGLNGGGQLMSSLNATTASYQIDRKFLQFTTDQVCIW